MLSKVKCQFFELKLRMQRWCFRSLTGCSCVSCAADHFKEICPAGHGYTYSRSDVQISLRQLDDVELQSMGVSLEDESPTYPQFPFSQPSFPSGPQYPSYPETPQLPQYPEYSETPQAPQYPLTPQHPSHPARETPRPPHTDGKNKFYVGKYVHCMTKSWNSVLCECVGLGCYLNMVFI